jgi:hypothetical protein
MIVRVFGEKYSITVRKNETTRLHFTEKKTQVIETRLYFRLIRPSP